MALPAVTFSAQTYNNTKPRHSGARAAQASVRSLRKLGCVPASPESITTAGGYGFRPSPLSRLGRNDEQALE
jgi:hypothetical protein